METTKIAVYVADEEASKFLLFQEHFDVFSTLLESQVFEQKNATILLDFDYLGVLQSVRRNDYLYSKKHVVPN
jgi:hypothetical protein